MLNSTLKNGRVITQVSTDNGSNHSVLAFAGNAFKFKKIHLKGHADKWVLIQHVDKVDITFAGETDRIEADGQCISDNVFEGKAHISCVADTPQGEFAVFFETDGTKPIIIHP